MEPVDYCANLNFCYFLLNRLSIGYKQRVVGATHIAMYLPIQVLFRYLNSNMLIWAMPWYSSSHAIED